MTQQFNQYIFDYIKILVNLQDPTKAKESNELNAEEDIDSKMAEILNDIEELFIEPVFFMHYLHCAYKLFYFYVCKIFLQQSLLF